jgi:hypothetical protein
MTNRRRALFIGTQHADGGFRDLGPVGERDLAAMRAQLTGSGHEVTVRGGDPAEPAPGKAGTEPTVVPAAEVGKTVPARAC